MVEINNAVIDPQGFRLNVGIVLINQQGKLLLGNRKGYENAWQFPQGGIHIQEHPRQAMLRELAEELGLEPQSVQFLSQTEGWLSYRLPVGLRRYDQHPLCVGQKQKWFFLKFLGVDAQICLDTTADPEFDAWKWVDYWEPLNHVVPFKRKVYQTVLKTFAPLIKPVTD